MVRRHPPAQERHITCSAELPDLALPDEDGTAVDIDRPSEPQRWVRTRGSSSPIRRIATWVQPLPRGDAKLGGRPWCSLALQTSNTSLLNDVCLLTISDVETNLPPTDERIGLARRSIGHLANVPVFSPAQLISTGSISSAGSKPSTARSSQRELMPHKRGSQQIRVPPRRPIAAEVTRRSMTAHRGQRGTPRYVPECSASISALWRSSSATAARTSSRSK